MNALNRHPYLPCILLGGAAACGFAPLQLWWLTLAGLAAWLWLVHAAPTMRSALLRGYAFGVGHFTINDNWFQHAFTFQDTMPPVIGYLAPFALALYLAIFPATAAALAWRLRGARIDAAWVLLAAAAWIATEWIRSWLFTGYAWDPLGVIWVPVQPVAWLATLVGTYALSGLTVALAGAVLLLPRSRRWWIVAGGLLTLLVAQVRGYTPPASSAPPGTPHLVVVQPDVAQDERGESDWFEMSRRLLALSGTPASYQRIVLWPEGVVRPFLAYDYPAWVYGYASPYVERARLARVLGPRDLLLAGDTPVRFGADGDIAGASNSVFALTADRRLVARYAKSHLVPYGEYLPMPWLLKPLGLARLVPGSLDFDAGPGPRSLDLPGVGAVGVQICYEIIFSGQVIDAAHRPRFLFNPSNDAWFGAWGPPQHLAQARMRAIEEGLPIVRSTPNGISAVIAADGTLVGTIAHKHAGVLDIPLPPAHAPTLFARVGNLMAAVVAALLVAAAIALRRRAR